MSKIKVDQIEGSTGSSITIPTGQTLTVTDGLPASTISSGTISDARLPANALNSNVDLTNLSASNMTSGTLPDARFPATLPAVSGANLTNLPVDLTNLSASNLTSGTVPDARFPATLPAISGANLTNLPVDLTNLNATNLTSGTVPDARFPSVLPAVSGANLTNLPGGGGFIPLASSTWTSNVSSVDFQNVFSSTYKSYKIFISSLLPTSDCDVRVGFLDTSNNLITAADYYNSHKSARFQGFGSPAYELNDSWSNNGFILNGYSTMGAVASNGDMSAELIIVDPLNQVDSVKNNMSFGYGLCSYRNGSVGQRVISTFSSQTAIYSSNTLGGIRINVSTGSIARGFAVIYGLNT